MTGTPGHEGNAYEWYLTSWKISISRKAQIFLPSTSLPPSLSQAGLWFLSTHSGEANWRANPWCYLSFCHLMFDTLYQAAAGLSPCNTPCHGFCLWGLSNALSEWGDQLWEGQDAGDRTPSASFTLSWNPKSFLPGTGGLLWNCHPLSPGTSIPRQTITS